MSGILSILYSATYSDHIERTVVLDSLFPYVKEPSEVMILYFIGTMNLYSVLTVGVQAKTHFHSDNFRW